ncbi:MAG: sel1 repeat family protein [Deltaproteobacteria bacterium]|nr:sel1 repeat family protein [Deltaproteobacteria bacterium]
MKVRLALQVGTSSLANTAAAATTIVPGAVAAASLAFATKPGWLHLAASALGAYFAVYGALQIRHAVRTRASDAVLDAEGFAIEGGPHQGVRVPWSDVDPARTHAETVAEKRLTVGKIVGDALFLVMSAIFTNDLELAPEEKVPIRKLHLGLRDGRTLLLAEAEHPAEQVSVDALLGTIRARTAPASNAPPVAPPDVLACASCRAPLPPVDADAAACRYCGAWTRMPDEVRARLRAHVETAQSRASIGRAIAHLLEQPGARAASTTLLLVAFASLALWAAVIAALGLSGFDTVGTFEVVWILLAGLLAVGALFVLARTALVRRRALHLLSAAFGARAPRDARSGWSCRRCGGPLPATEGLVARCGFCDAESVLGIDLRSDVAPTRSHASDLEGVLAGARKERRSYLWLAAGAVLVATFAGGMASVTIEDAREHARWKAACDGDEASACRKLAQRFDYGHGVAKDQDAAFVLYRKACKLGDGEACDSLASFYILGLGTTVDMAAGDRARARACKLGYAKACKQEHE